ncbi:MAG: 4-oxalomesaconate tautomerase [Pseudomonadota bacterium]
MSDPIDGVRCMWMRGGTSKGGYFLADDLPDDRDAFLSRVMGSPDPRQIDGMGGADPLTSKVAIVRKSARPGIDVDYLFLQVAVDQPTVSDGQNCGNILAGVGPFAIERGLVPATSPTTEVTIYQENTDQVAIATIQTPSGRPTYEGNAQIDGVPGTAAPVSIEFKDSAGSTCGALLPTGNPADIVEGIEVTMIDNGMPVVVCRASDFGITGLETREELDANTDLKARLEKVRHACGQLINLGDVSQKTVPKMTMVSPAQAGGIVSTRTFIPHRCHASIGVLGAVSVATACFLDRGPAAELATIKQTGDQTVSVEHPSGSAAISVKIDEDGTITSAAVVRTARKLFDGFVF